MNLRTLRTHPIFKLRLAARGPSVEPARWPATLSQQELRRAVAAMID